MKDHLSVDKRDKLLKEFIQPILSKKEEKTKKKKRKQTRRKWEMGGKEIVDSSSEPLNFPAMARS